MIDTKINNVREKVDLLQMYGPKLLRECEKQRDDPHSTVSVIQSNKPDDKSITMEDISDVAFRIVEAMVFYTAHGQAFRKQDAHLELNAKQVVRVEDLLQIFVDHHDLMTEFLERILNAFSEQRFNDLERLTQIKLYNRLLECYLVKKQKVDSDIEKKRRIDPTYQPSGLELDDLVKVDAAINNLVKSNDSSKIDEHYMLFLFKIYGSEEGIVNCCQTNKNLKHELLNFYIQKKDSVKVLEVCQGKEFMLQQEPVNGDMWIQALTYFRD